LGVVVVGNMNGTDGGGMLGVGTECYVLQGVHWMMGVIDMDIGHRFGGVIVPNLK